jgi:SnoaL-like domain
MSADLEARMRRLEAERDITNTLHLYGFHADSGDHAAFVDLFTEDATIELIGGTPDGTHGALEVWNGHDAIRAYIDDPTMHMKIEGRCMHLAALNLRIEVDEDRADADSDSVVLLHENDGISIYGAGFTRWTLRYENDRWLIARRVRVAIGDAQIQRRFHEWPPSPSPE